MTTTTTTTAVVAAACAPQHSAGPTCDVKEPLAKTGQAQDPQPELGMQVQVTVDYGKLDMETRRAISTEGNRATLGVEGTIETIRATKPVVQFIGADWWIPIRALVGFEEWKPKAPAKQ